MFKIIGVILADGKMCSVVHTSSISTLDSASEPGVYFDVDGNAYYFDGVKLHKDIQLLYED